MARGFWREIEGGGPPSAASTSGRPPGGADGKSPYARPAATPARGRGGSAPARPNLWIGCNGQKVDWASVVSCTGADNRERTMLCRVPNNTELCRKTNLATNLRRYQESSGEVFDFIPFTLVLVAKTSTHKQWMDFKEAVGRHAAQGEKVWIVKPNAMNR
jgi:hypothetical protein